MKSPLDFLEYLYELDFSQIDVTQIAKALISFGASVMSFYIGRFAYYVYPQYFLFVLIPIALAVCYPAYTGVLALKKAFEKEEEFIVYSGDEGLVKKRI